MVPKIIREGYKVYRNIRETGRVIFYTTKAKILRIPEWKNPDENDFIEIEKQLQQHGIALFEINFDKKKFEQFKNQFDFGSDFYGGSCNTIVFNEKILEHYIAFTMAVQKMPSKKDVYIDIAAANSPWARLLRDKGYTSYAIDLSPSQFQDLEYYQTMDATATLFPDSSVSSASLQCAYEMFNHDDDIRLICELKRILTVGGRVIISPLYMNTHYSGYCSPEFWNKRESHPSDAILYVNTHSVGIPFSRKYDADKFQERIVRTIQENNMDYHLYVLRNPKELDPNIYCHFILEIIKQ